MASNPNTTYGDASKIRFAPQGHIYIGSSDAIKDNLPKGVSDDPAETYKGKVFDLGYVDQSGVTITPGIETEPINVWQSAVPVLTHLKGASFKLKATLMEMNKATTQMFFGADWANMKDGGKDVYRLDLKSTPELREFVAIVDWSQVVMGNDINYRCVIPRSMLSERGAITLQRTENSKFEMTLDALDRSGLLGYVLTDDPTMATETPPPPPQQGGEQNNPGQPGGEQVNPGSGG